jgi:DNA-binding Lrp family transcriptional regulator
MPISSKPKSWRDVLKVHPAADLFPMMPPDELRALGEDIKKNGLREGVALLDGALLDGRNRLEAMELAGIKLFTGNGQLEWANIPSRNVKGTDPVAYVISKNIQRRHLTTEQKRELIEKLVKATPDKSDRQIAEQTKTSPTTVGKVRKKMEAAGHVSKLDTRIDKDGRKQRAHKTPHKITTSTPPSLLQAEKASPAFTDRAVIADEVQKPKEEAANSMIKRCVLDMSMMINRVMEQLLPNEQRRLIEQLSGELFEIESRWMFKGVSVPSKRH